MNSTIRLPRRRATLALLSVATVAVANAFTPMAFAASSSDYIGDHILEMEEEFTSRSSGVGKDSDAGRGSATAEHDDADPANSELSSLTGLKPQPGLINVGATTPSPATPSPDRTAPAEAPQASAGALEHWYG